MIKVMWFLKKAEHLTIKEFGEWWLHTHCFDVARHQSPHLKKYVVNVRSGDDGFTGTPANAFEWDGVAEQWFADRESFNAVYGRPDSPTRADTLSHTSALARLIVEELEVPLASTGLPAKK